MGQIRGIVIAAETGAPLHGARVVVWSGDSPPRETVTDPAGRYEVAQLPTGKYFVSASHSEYLAAAFGSRLPRLAESGSAVAVEAGQTLEHIDFALPRAGTIAVGVTDHLGEPLAGVLVQVQRFQYSASGKRQLTNAPTGIRGPATTDNRGEIRVVGLMPGKYVIRGSVRSIRPADAARPTVTAGFASTYYPGTMNADEAQIVTLGTSEETAVHFPMIASRLGRVSGTIVTSAGLPAAGMDLQLGPREGDSGIVSGAGSSRADGTFEIAGVPRGNYTLRVRQPSVRVRGEFASVPLIVDGDDVTGLRIATSAGTTISGRVVFDGVSTPPPTSELRVFALPPGLAGGGWVAMGSSVYDFPPEGSVEADGHFQITGASGRVQLDTQTEGWALKSVTLDGRDVTDEALDVTAMSSLSGVEFTLTDKVTAVSGHVRDRDGQLVGNYVVILLPREATSRRIHVSHSVPDGHFEVRRVRPGRYLAAAVEWMEYGRQFAPEFQQQLRGGAREFSVREGESLMLDLTLTSDS